MRLKILLVFIIFLNHYQIYAEQPEWHPIEQPKYQMIVLAEVFFFDRIFDSTYAKNNKSLGAFGQGGEDDCRSLAKWITPVPGAHNGYWYFTIGADQNNENISFKLYNSEDDSVYQCDAEISFNNNDLLGAGISGFFPIKVKNSSISGSVSVFSSVQSVINPEDIIITIGDSIVSVNPEYNFSLEIPIGDYSVTADAKGFYPITFENNLVEESRDTKINFTLIEWFPDTSFTEQVKVFTKIKYLDNSYMTGNENSLVSVFSMHNPELCLGVGNWDKHNSFWEIQLNYSDEIDSVFFKIYDDQTYHIFNCKEVLSLNNDYWGTTTQPIEISINSIQDLILNKGWNWISFNVEIENESLETIFGNDIDSMVQVKSQTQSALWYPDYDCWIGDLEVMDSYQSYMVKSQIDSLNIKIEGKPIIPDKEILLPKKWSWIPYFPYNDFNLNIALESILPEINLVKDKSDSIIYNQDNSYEEYPKMYSGQGYKIKMNSAKYLYYPGFLKGVKPLKKSVRNCKYDNVVSGTENSMIFLTRIFINNEELIGENGNQAFVIKRNNDGDEYRGIGIYENNNEWPGFWYFTVVGDIEEDLVIDIYNNNDYHENIQTIQFKKDTLIGNPESPLIINLEVSIEDEQTSFDYQLNQNYPNPFNPITNIEFYLQKSGNVDITIYDIHGRVVNNLLNSYLKHGKHILIWDSINLNGNKVPSGIYFYKIRSNGFETTKKMILNK